MNTRLLFLRLVPALQRNGPIDVDWGPLRLRFGYGLQDVPPLSFESPPPCQGDAVGQAYYIPKEALEGVKSGQELMQKVMEFLARCVKDQQP